MSSASVSITGPRAPRFLRPDRDTVVLPRTANNNFRRDIIRCFNGDGGGIGFYGYAGEGGKLYARWLAENRPYRSDVTLAENEVTIDSAPDIAKLCPSPSSFLQIGASGSHGVFFSKPFALIRAISVEHGIHNLEYKVADVSEDSFRTSQKFVRDLGLDVSPQFIQGNFYTSLKNVRDIDVGYIPGISTQNPYFNLMKNSTESVLHHQLSYFRRSLAKGGVLIFSFANDNGIDSDGGQLKTFYDDPLIHGYQKTIFQRVQRELNPSGDYKPDGFKIRHDWHAGNYVLTRHAITTEPMSFAIGKNHFNWGKGHEDYISNNTRFPDDMALRVGRNAGFSDGFIFGPPTSTPQSNMRLAVLVNG